MITTLKNDDGYIYAYMEWRLVSKYGLSVGEKEYIFIKDLWIHQWHRGNGSLQDLIDEVSKDPLVKKTKFVYWNNLKRNRLSKTYSKTRFKKGAKK